jgi:hypothetical protein
VGQRRKTTFLSPLRDVLLSNFSSSSLQLRLSYMTVMNELQACTRRSKPTLPPPSPLVPDSVSSS